MAGHRRRVDMRRPLGCQILTSAANIKLNTRVSLRRSPVWPAYCATYSGRNGPDVGLGAAPEPSPWAPKSERKIYIAGKSCRWAAYFVVPGTLVWYFLWFIPDGI
jgi:hypothetical protein